QAEDGIRYRNVTGVQTCALPISGRSSGAKGGFFPKQLPPMSDRDAWMAAGQAAYEVFIESMLEISDNLTYGDDDSRVVVHPDREIGRASCRERAARTSVDRTST